MTSVERNYDHLLKIVIVGDDFAGKSSLLQRFVGDSFSHNAIKPTSVDFKIKTVDISGEQIKLQIWDIAGQERLRTITTPNYTGALRTITTPYYTGAHGFIVVYDITDVRTFDNLSW